MKSKILIMLLFILFAIPIDIALFGFLVSCVVIGFVISEGLSYVHMLPSLFVIVAVAVYFWSYAYALLKTWKEKKITAKTFLPILSGVLTVVFVILLMLNPANSDTDITPSYFGFEKEDFSVAEELDTHGGFQGEGSHYLILDCSGNKEKAMEIIEGQNKLPLSENIGIAMFGREKDGVAYGYEFAKEAHMPRVKNGYYIFRDDQLEGEDCSDDSELLNRHSFNFRIAVYDCDTDRMYYFELDT